MQPVFTHEERSPSEEKQSETRQNQACEERAQEKNFNKEVDVKPFNHQDSELYEWNDVANRTMLNVQENFFNNKKEWCI